MSQAHDRSVGTKSARRRAKYLARQNRELIEQLVQVRRDAGLLQPDVAKLLGISQQAVSEFERMVTPASLPRISNYAQAVGALVTHHVAADHGQLDSIGHGWIQIRTLPVNEPAGSMAYESHLDKKPHIATREAQAAFGTTTTERVEFNGARAFQPAAESKRKEFSLAA